MAEAVIANGAMALAETGEDALESAVREHARLVYRIAYSVLRNHQDAEDATQETFVRVLRYGRKLEGVRDQKTWLARIAWRVAIERRKKLPEIPLDEQGEDLALDVRSDFNNLSSPEEHSSQPIIRQIKINGRTLTAPGKLVVIGAVDDPNSNRTFQLEAAVARLK